MENKPVIGIHIGTTHIAVATIRNGILDMISNDQGKKRTPFYVAFNESEQLIGQSALDQAEANPQNTIYANNRKNLGGKDIDQRMANHFIEEFKIEFNHEIGRDKHELHHLKMQCKRMKGVLSNASEAKFEVEGTDLTATMTRERFEELLDDLFQKTIDLVGKTLKDSGIGKKEIDEIILTGGCTRIPRIQELLSKFFNGKELKTSIDPDQCVARGAAKQAEILQKKLHK
uniref:CSON012224 protein n=1 Tax=Culicoides sonorensis TaxID=179676 RepID=A0A336M4Y7_CULSO